GFPIPVVGGHTPVKGRNRSVVFFRRVKRIGRVATFEDRAETALRADFYFVVAGTGYRCPAEEGESYFLVIVGRREKSGLDIPLLDEVTDGRPVGDRIAGVSSHAPVIVDIVG